jgi:hypothetical protein
VEKVSLPVVDILALRGEFPLKDIKPGTIRQQRSTSSNGENRLYKRSQK